MIPIPTFLCPLPFPRSIVPCGQNGEALNVVKFNKFFSNFTNNTALIASAMTTSEDCRCPVGTFPIRFTTFRNL